MPDTAEKTPGIPKIRYNQQGFLIITDSGEAREYDIGFKDLPDIPGRDIRFILLSAVILPDTAEKTPGIPKIRYNQSFFMTQAVIKKT
ncbi:Uncharacterized protein dnm_100430 [Desulfonema magnum]|uniref:Uncharacterized protein n=1 Tax=Desulfonema magnum TaxID=45655 RepID=A0A975BYX3_9BACT|nr:Uncharacterized protein dnm_100430 [Desulfonema magnum]